MPVQELVLVVPISILRAISRMPIKSRLEVAVRDSALRKLSTELLSTVHLLISQPLVPGTGGAEAAPTPRCVSIYVWRADAKQSDLGAASVAVYTQLKKEFPDGGLVRICTQFDNVPLNQAQQAVAVDWDSRLRTMYLRTTEGAEEWTDAALAFFTTVVGGSAVHNWRTALRADADASVMTVVGAAVPTISVNLENLRRAVHNTNLCKPPRERWNADFVAPESATLFSAVTERTWAWTSTSAGVFREKTMVRSSTDFDQLATALARTPSSSERRKTGSQPPAAVDFGSRSGGGGLGGDTERSDSGRRGGDPSGRRTRPVCTRNGGATSAPRARSGGHIAKGGHLPVEGGEHTPGQTSRGYPG